jgi:hypothetical protein
MDQTLIESVFPDDPRYRNCPGKIISYQEGGKKVTFKVNVRPYALHAIKSIKKHGLDYVIWSAGTYYYVHAVMAYVTELCQVAPDLIYTRDDMVIINGHRRKSLGSKNFNSDYVIIIEDHPDFVDPSERKHVISVSSWTFDNKQDVELQWVSSLLATYGVISSFYNNGYSNMLDYTDTCHCPYEVM